MLAELRSWWQGLRASFALGDPVLRNFWQSGVWGNGSVSATGISVSERTALTSSAVWAAVQCIAGDVASLPFLHYQRTADGGKRRYDTSRLYRVLHDEFNSEMSAMVGREVLTGHALLWGNGYAEIQRDNMGRVIALWPLTPERVMPMRTTPFGPITYRVARADGTQVDIGADALFHLVGLGYDGLMGYPVIQMARESIGVSLAAEQLGAAMFANGTTYSGFFQHPRSLGATALGHLKDSIAKDKPGGYRILEEGMTFVPGSMPLKDAQWLDSRKFQVNEIARWFGIPPHKLGDLERATFSNIEESNIEYVTHTLRRWLVRWEQECNRKLIAPLEKGIQFCEHVIDGLLRGNVQSRYQAYSIGRNGGWLSANDIRSFENMNPIDGGDIYLIQGAMVPLDRLNDVIDAQVATGTGPAESAAPGDQPAAAAPDAPSEQVAALPSVQALVADLAAQVTQRNAALAAELTTVVQATAQAQDAALEARVAADRTLRDWQQATLALIAGRCVRRELAQLKKCVGPADGVSARLEKFYARFVADACTELEPWYRRLRPEGGDPPMRPILEAWAQAAQAECRHALENGGLAAMLPAWTVGREDALTRQLWEALHG